MPCCCRNGSCKWCTCVKAENPCTNYPTPTTDPQCLPSPLPPTLPNILTSLQVTDNESSTQLPPPETIVFTWGNHSAFDISNILEATYSEVVHWRRNCFTLPFGKAGREFVSELSKLYQAFAPASALESIALKAATVLQIQKPQKASKAKEHATCLDRRLRSWKGRLLHTKMMTTQTQAPQTLHPTVRDVLLSKHPPISSSSPPEGTLMPMSFAQLR